MAVAAAQQPVPQALLPQQALEIAAQAAEQVQNARGAAQAAITAASGTAAVLVNALNANEVTPTPRAPVPLTAQQARPPPPRGPRCGVGRARGHRRRQARQPARRRDRRHQEHRARGRNAAPERRRRAAAHGAAHRRRGRASVAGRGSTARAPEEESARCRPQRRRSSASTPPACRTIWRNRWPSRPSASSRCPCSTRRHRSAAGRAAGRHARRRHALGRRPGPATGGDEQQRAPRVQTAELRLDPPDLGPLRVSLNGRRRGQRLFRVGARLGAPGH